MTGKLITIEGTEGAGKSTNLKVIEDTLREANIEFITTREPGGTLLAENIRKLLLEKGSEVIHEKTEVLLMFASRMQHLSQLIEPALNKNIWVVCDRFTDASFAYQGYGRGLDLSIISSLKDIVHPQITPDLTIVLDVPVKIAMDRVRKRGKLDRFEQENLNFFNKIRNGYKEIVKNNRDRCIPIDASKSMKVVEKAIRGSVMEFIKKHN